MEIDAATLKACRAGDPAAFRRLVEAHQQPVLSLCVALAGADGEDLAQETFVRVHAAIARFEPDRGPGLRPWILTIARRLCQDRARHLKMGIEVAAPALAEAAADPAPGPAEQAAAVRLEARVRRALAALPEEQRTVIALFEWEGLDYEEIAAVEGVPIGTIRSRLSRARASLRAAVDEERGEERHRALGR